MYMEFSFSISLKKLTVSNLFIITAICLGLQMFLKLLNISFLMIHLMIMTSLVSNNNYNYVNYVLEYKMCLENDNLINHLIFK